MKTCRNCGFALNDNEIYCHMCGAAQNVNYTQNAYQPPYPAPVRPVNPVYMPVYQPVPAFGYGMPMPAPLPVPMPAPKVNNRKPGTLASLIWSLILVVVFNPIGTILAVIAAFFAADGGDEDCDAEKSRQQIKKAYILCLAATIIDAATIFYFILVIVNVAKISSAVF